MQHEERDGRPDAAPGGPEPSPPAPERGPGGPEMQPRSSPPSLPEPDLEPPLLNLGLFERINNYILLFYAAACLFMNLALAGLLYYKGLVVLSLSLPGIVSIILPFFLLTQRSALGFFREFRLGALDWRTVALVVVVSAAAILPVESFSSIFERMRHPDADYTKFILSIKPKGTASFVSIAAGVVFVAAMAEELLFRGFIQRIFQRNMNGPLAVAFAGILFSLTHFNPPAIPGIAALGILYGFLFYTTGNLWYSIMGHGIFNLVSLVRLNYSTEESVASANVVAPDVTWTLASLLLFVLGIWLLRRLYRGRRVPR